MAISCRLCNITVEVEGQARERERSIPTPQHVHAVCHLMTGTTGRPCSIRLRNGKGIFNSPIIMYFCLRVHLPNHTYIRHYAPLCFSLSLSLSHSIAVIITTAMPLLILLLQFILALLRSLRPGYHPIRHHTCDSVLRLISPQQLTHRCNLLRVLAHL